jgi:CubicO group peptidase (beta-lactamase class C family)
MYAPSTTAELRSTAVTGRNARGRMREAWTGEAVAPAGGIRSSVSDMARLAQALLDGSAPGCAALDPVQNFTGRAVRIGAGWVTLQVQGREVTWHNGGTGGFRTWMGLDRKAGTAVVLLSATAISVDRHGFAMLRELGE